MDGGGLDWIDKFAQPKQDEYAELGQEVAGLPPLDGLRRIREVGFVAYKIIENPLWVFATKEGKRSALVSASEALATFRNSEGTETCFPYAIHPVFHGSLTFAVVTLDGGTDKPPEVLLFLLGDNKIECINSRKGKTVFASENEVWLTATEYTTAAHAFAALHYNTDPTNTIQ